MQTRPWLDERDLDPDAHFWATVLQEVRHQVAKANYDTLLRDRQIIGREEGVLIVGVPNTFTRDWLNSRFASLLRKTASAIAGEHLDVRCVATGNAVTE